MVTPCCTMTEPSCLRCSRAWQSEEILLILQRRAARAPTCTNVAEHRRGRNNEQRKNPSWESLTNRGREAGFQEHLSPPRLSDSLQDQIAELPLLCLKHRQGFPLLAYLFHQSSWKGGKTERSWSGKSTTSLFVSVGAARELFALLNAAGSLSMLRYAAQL